MKNLLKFKRSYDRKSGLNNPLINRVVEIVGFDKALIPPYSKMVKVDHLYYNNKIVQKFIDDLYELAVNVIKANDAEQGVKDLSNLKKDLIASNTLLMKSRDKFFKNERLAMNARDNAELDLLDSYLKVDKDELKKAKEKQKEVLAQIECQYRKENYL